MAIKEVDLKLLWGRAAGICSKPDCAIDLTSILSGKTSYVTGEMAHVIAHAEGGPRGRKGGGTDSYKNLILLCPNCHTHIDKAPAGEFTEKLLLEWKFSHEETIRSTAKKIRHLSFEKLCAAISPMLDQNYMIFKTYGPSSGIALADPSSNAVEIWKKKKTETIIPNNQDIVDIITANLDIVPDKAKGPFMKFREHSQGFAENNIGRLDYYPLFPQSFAEEFRNGKRKQ